MYVPLKAGSHNTAAAARSVGTEIVGTRECGTTEVADRGGDRPRRSHPRRRGGGGGGRCESGR